MRVCAIPAFSAGRWGAEPGEFPEAHGSDNLTDSEVLRPCLKQGDRGWLSPQGSPLTATPQPPTHTGEAGQQALCQILLSLHRVLLSNKLTNHVILWYYSSFFLSLLPIVFQHQDNIKIKKGSLDLHYSFLPKRNGSPLDLHYPCLSKRNTQNRAGWGWAAKRLGLSINGD